MKRILNYFTPITINQIKHRMAEVQSNIDMYAIIINRPEVKHTKSYLYHD